MSGILFAVIAVGWAAYLLPMALKRHDDVAKSRPVEEFSDSMRVLGRRRAAGAGDPTPLVETVETHNAHTRSPSSAPTITRDAARRAARRRRRVLALLLLAAVAVSVTSYLGYTPWFVTAIPGVLVVAFLVVARLTVRAQQVRRVAPVQHSAPAPLTAEETEPDLASEDTVGLSLDELADAVASPVLDEGSLWDPLPVTLPTYVNKARARRTVRTIEITATTTGITSSGHDAADSALAREAEAQQTEVEVEADVVEAPKAAGA